MLQKLQIALQFSCVSYEVSEHLNQRTVLAEVSE
jgi:hypothetical protein